MSDATHWRRNTVQNVVRIVGGITLLGETLDEPGNSTDLIGAESVGDQRSLARGSRQDGKDLVPIFRRRSIRT